MLKVLISDPIDEEGVKILSDAGFIVDNQPGLDKSKLASIISQYDVLIVRGRTKVDSSILRDSTLKSSDARVSALTISTFKQPRRKESLFSTLHALPQPALQNSPSG